MLFRFQTGNIDPGIIHRSTAEDNHNMLRLTRDKLKIKT